MNQKTRNQKNKKQNKQKNKKNKIWKNLKKKTDFQKKKLKTSEKI